MTHKVEHLDQVLAAHLGCYAALHFVNNKAVCAPCARKAFKRGLEVQAGAFDEGDPVECSTVDCGAQVHSTYGPV